jgi:hypothetical protein
LIAQQALCLLLKRNIRQKRYPVKVFSALIERKQNEETLRHIKIELHSWLYSEFCISFINGLHNSSFGSSFCLPFGKADGKIHPFKKGGFFTAIETGLPILPVTINGSRKALPKGSMVFHPGPIEVVVSDPIETRRYDADQVEALIKTTRDIIISNYDSHYPDKQQPLQASAK